MRLKEYPEISLDVIPKLYEIQSKVIITNLYGVVEQLDRLPKKFCKMYTTLPLAKQLLHHLTKREDNISGQDFHIVEPGEPFTLRLSDGKRLEVMLCAGNELRNSLMLLIRKMSGGRLLYYYSAVQQDDLSQLMGNVTYQEWIAQGTEVLYLNLEAADQPFSHIDFDEEAMAICKYREDVGSPAMLELPLFGYEYLIKRLAQTYSLYGHIGLLGNFLESYSCLNSDPESLMQPGYVTTLNIIPSSEKDLSLDSFQLEPPYPLEKLRWSPVPTRMNLIQLCSLLRPLSISGIVAYHAAGNLPSVPEYLKRFRLRNSPKPKGVVEDVRISKTQLIEIITQSDDNNSRKLALVISKQRNFAFVDYDDDDDE